MVPDGRTEEWKEGRTDRCPNILTFVYLCVFSISKNSHLIPFLATLPIFYVSVEYIPFISHLKYVRDTQTLP